MYRRDYWERLTSAWAAAHHDRMLRESGPEREAEARAALRDALDREELVAVGSMREPRQAEHASA